MNQTHVNKNQTHMKKKKKNQTHQTEPINPSTKQMQIKPIKTTRNQSTHPPPPWEPDLRKCRTGLSSLALRQRRTDVGLPCGFLWWARNSPMAQALAWVRRGVNRRRKEKIE